MFHAFVTNSGDSRYHATTQDSSFVLDTKGNGANPIDALLASLAACVGHHVIYWLRDRAIPNPGFQVAATGELSEDRSRLSAIRLVADLRAVDAAKEAYGEILQYVALPHLRNPGARLPDRLRPGRVGQLGRRRIFTSLTTKGNLTMKRSLLIALMTLLLCADTYAEEARPLKEHEIEQIALKVAREAVQGGYQLLSAADLKKMVDGKDEFVLVDAYPPKDFALGSIAGAVNFGFAGIRSGKWDEDALGKSQESYKALLGSDLNRKVVVYCGFNVCGRSHNAAMWARELGYTNVYRMPGGTRAWKDAGYAYQAAN